MPCMLGLAGSRRKNSANNYASLIQPYSPIRFRWAGGPAGSRRKNDHYVGNKEAGSVCPGGMVIRGTLSIFKKSTVRQQKTGGIGTF